MGVSGEEGGDVSYVGQGLSTSGCEDAAGAKDRVAIYFSKLFIFGRYHGKEENGVFYGFFFPLFSLLPQFA